MVKFKKYTIMLIFLKEVLVLGYDQVCSQILSKFI